MWRSVMETLPYEHIRWIENEDSRYGQAGRNLGYEEDSGSEGQTRCLLFVNAWSVGMVLDRNEGLVLSEFGRE